MRDDYKVSASRLRKILDRLDREYEQNKLSCIEWIAFFFLKVLVYAFPLLVSAVLVSRLLPERPFLGALQNLLGYTLILAAVSVPANLRLIARSLRHYRLTQHFHYRLANRLWGKRGRPEESPDAVVAVLAGLPALLFLLFAQFLRPAGSSGAGGWMLVVSVIVCAGIFLVLREVKRSLDQKGRRSDSYYGVRAVLQSLRRSRSGSDDDSSEPLTRRERRRAHLVLVGGAVVLALLLALTIVLGVVDAGPWWKPPLVLAICFGLFLALHEAHQLAEYPRRRLDFLREVKVLFRVVRQKAERAKGLPVVLTRSVALRLSDIDRMFTMRRRTAAILNLQEEGTVGYTLSMSSRAMAGARELPQIDRMKTHMAIEELGLDAKAREGRATDGEYIVAEVPGAALELLYTVDDEERVVRIESVGPTRFSDGTLEAGSD